MESNEEQTCSTFLFENYSIMPSNNFNEIAHLICLISLMKDLQENAINKENVTISKRVQKGS